MADPISNKGFGDAALAERVIELYAEEVFFQPETLTERLGMDPGPSLILYRTLTQAPFSVNVIDTGDAYRLEIVGFSREFVSTLRGDDGAKALRHRVRRLADRWRWDAEAEVRAQYLSALEDCIVNIPEVKKMVAEETLPILVRIMQKDPEPTIRAKAVLTLGNLGPAAASAVEEIIVASSQGNTRPVLTAWVLGFIRSRPEIAIPYLIQLAKNNNGPDLTPSFISAVSRFGAQALPWILEGMEDPEPAVRSHMASALSAMGEKAYLALPILQDMMRQDPDETCRNAAREAIKQIESEVL